MYVTLKLYPDIILDSKITIFIIHLMPFDYPLAREIVVTWGGGRGF